MDGSGTRAGARCSIGCATRSGSRSRRYGTAEKCSAATKPPQPVRAVRARRRACRRRAGRLVVDVVVGQDQCMALSSRLLEPEWLDELPGIGSARRALAPRPASHQRDHGQRAHHCAPSRAGEPRSRPRRRRRQPDAGSNLEITNVDRIHGLDVLEFLQHPGRDARRDRRQPLPASSRRGTLAAAARARRGARAALRRLRAAALAPRRSGRAGCSG